MPSACAARSVVHTCVASQQSYYEALTSCTLAAGSTACYWFSNGCNIGCDSCDGTYPSPGHDDESYSKFLFKSRTKAQLMKENMTTHERQQVVAGLWSPEPGDMTIDPSLKPVPPGIMPKPGEPNPKPVIRSNCGKLVKPSLCDKRLRTLNTQAECGTPEDIYQLSPWRAPGTAPVIDSWYVCRSCALPRMGPSPRASSSLHRMGSSAR